MLCCENLYIFVDANRIFVTKTMCSLTDLNDGIETGKILPEMLKVSISFEIERENPVM